MELHEALRQISDIRQQMARGEIYRGYRSVMVGGSGVVALLAATVQPALVPSPQADLGRYLALWTSVAGASLIAAGFEMSRRARHAGAGLARELTVLAAEQFLPCVAIGAILTLCIALGSPEVAWMLPGLWALVYSLGVFASHRLLPHQVVWVGAYYAACGCGCLLFGQADQAFSPWLMAVPFGGGQLLSAAILYWTLERCNDPQGQR